MTARQTVGPPVGSKWMNVLGQPVTVVAVTQDAHGGVLITLDTENRVRQYMDMKTWNNIEEKTAIPPPEVGSLWDSSTGRTWIVEKYHAGWVSYRNASGGPLVHKSLLDWHRLAFTAKDMVRPENNREKAVWNAAIEAAIEAGTPIDNGYVAERIRNLIK